MHGAKQIPFGQAFGRRGLPGPANEILCIDFFRLDNGRKPGVFFIFRTFLIYLFFFGPTILRVNSRPSQILHNCSHGLEAFFSNLGNDDSSGFDTIGKVCSQKTACDQFVYLQLVTLEIFCGVLRRYQSRVIFNLFIVHETFVENHGPAIPKICNKGLQISDLALSNGLDPACGLLDIRLCQVPGIRARIADELGFIEILSHFQGMLRRESETFIRFFLEIGEVIKQFRLFLFRPGCDRSNFTGKPGQLIRQRLCVIFQIEPVLIFPLYFPEP